MSEKRFELDRIGIFDNKTNHFYYKTFDNEDVVALLNQLADENEQLRQRIAFFEKQADEFEKYTAQTIQNMIANYRDGE